MKRTLIPLFALLLSVLLIGGCSPSPTEQPPDTTSPPIPLAPSFHSFTELEQAPGITSVTPVPLELPAGIDVSALPEESAEQLRILMEEFTVWEIAYTVDGVPVIAYAAAADGYQSGGPLILYARGGNGSFGANTPMFAASYAYTSGCTVIAPNYREADEFGGADVEDVVFWLDIIPALEFVNSEKVWLLGESRGGMQACLTLLRDESHIVRAAACISGIYDVVNNYEVRTDMREMLRRRIGGSPQQCPEEYEKRSAVTFADQIDTPLLLIHSTGDEKVPYNQAVTFAAELEKYGKSHEFITYENSTHGITTAAMMEEIVQWLQENGK